MSPRLLATLIQHRNGMAIAALDSDPALRWVYGLNPLGRDHLRVFRSLQQYEREVV